MLLARPTQNGNRQLPFLYQWLNLAIACSVRVFNDSIFPKHLLNLSLPKSAKDQNLHVHRQDESKKRITVCSILCAASAPNCDARDEERKFARQREQAALSPSQHQDDIIGMEIQWTPKLQNREMGLNRY